MQLRHALLAIVALCALALAPFRAPLAADYVEGRQYSRLQMPQPSQANGKVEVIEFFWYGCPHCADLEPLLKQWTKQLPGDVSFRKVPAILNESWAPGARLYYTFEAMGLLDKLNDAAFDAMVKQHIKLGLEATLLVWVASKGVDRRAFADTYNSFSVGVKVKQAAEMTQEYGFSGVPALIVGGKYTPGPQLRSAAEMLTIADYLIAKSRSELKPSPATKKPATKKPATK